MVIRFKVQIMPTRVFDILQKSAEIYPNKTALSHKQRGKWKRYSFSQYSREVEKVALWLLDLGVKKGDRVTTITSNCPEWNFFDMAIMQCGAIHVSLFPTFNKDDFRFVLNDCGAKFVFVSGRLLLNMVKGACVQVSSVASVLEMNDYRSYYNEYEQNVEAWAKQQLVLEERKTSVKPQDLAAICYSSGTYKSPLGAVFSHLTLCNLVTSWSTDYEITDKDKALSYLPVCHAYEKGFNLIYQYIGVAVYYAESTSSVIQNIKEVGPTILTTVPVLVEKIFEGLLDEQLLEKSGIELSYKEWKNSLAKAMNHVVGEPRPILPQRVQDYFHKTLGGHLRIISSSGAPMPERFANALWAMGVSFYEIYGMTEVFTIATNSKKTGVRSGTVGKPQANVIIKLADDGEVLLKSKYAMIGYYNNPEKTKVAFDEDGWFHTGDLGSWEDGGFLKLIGRKKTVFKVSNGKYLLPEWIESVLTESEMILQVVVHQLGGNVEALIVPTPGYFGKHSLTEALRTLKNEVDRLYNDTVEDLEQISHIRIHKSPWSIESGELTPSMKLRRKVILDRGLNK
ncbi:MAG: long-chain acyl-CoA synthetase [Bacteroidia bacterium]|jgi:long-chain acyl-CoA synthetase